jgi:hypothetical protein
MKTNGSFIKPAIKHLEVSFPQSALGGASGILLKERFRTSRNDRQKLHGIYLPE